MVAQFEWKDEFNLGVERIDKEHQRLFKIINKLFSFQEEDKNGQWACQEGIKYFRTHTVKHFADEEAYMSEIHYSGLERHRQIHTNFRENTLPALERELERTDYAPDAVEHFLGVCAGWLIGHTMTEDLAITGKHAQRWEKLLPGEEINALRKAIIQTVFDLFHLESKLISDVYSGERFGNGLYYRLVYSTGQDEQWQEIIIAFEEKLLINTVGKMMGIQTNSLDSMLIHATRYTAQQFVQRIMEQFPAMEHYKLTEENLLTYEQLQELFKREQLQACCFTPGAPAILPIASSPRTCWRAGSAPPSRRATRCRRSSGISQTARRRRLRRSSAINGKSCWWMTLPPSGRE